MGRSSAVDVSVPGRLRANHLSAWEAIGQSLATLAPTSGPAVIIPLVLASSGNATWFVFVIATVAAVCISYQINTFARRSSSPGSLYTYVGLGLPRASIATAWALMIAYVGTASGTACLAVMYVRTLLFPAVAASRAGTLWMTLAAIAVATLLAWFDVKISTRLMLTLEGLSVLLILLLYVLPGHASALHVDRTQLLLTGVTLRQIRSGLVLGFFAFVGFESAASLGDEVMHPLRNIPRAIMASALIGGIFFIVSAYAEQIAFAGRASMLTSSFAPLKVLGDVRGYPAFGTVLMMWCVVGATACVSACIQATARMLYGMSRDGQCAAILRRTHRQKGSPHIAILVTSAAIALPAAVLILMGVPFVNVYGWLGSFATLGFLTAYACVTLAAVRVQLRTGSFGVVSAACTVLIAITIALSISSSFDPSVTGIDRMLPFLYLVVLGAGVLYTRFLHGPLAVSARGDMETACSE